MGVKVGFWIELGYSVTADNISQEELSSQLADWMDEHHTLDGLTLASGEVPEVKVVNFSFGEC